MMKIQVYKIAALALFALFGSSWNALAALKHPGGWHTEADLERIRANVAAGREPWKSAWAVLEKGEAGPDATAHVAPQNLNNYMIQNDGHTAYVLAIKWVASGDMRYAKAAIRMIDDWVATVQAIGAEPMRSGLGGGQMAEAAEILARGFNGSAGEKAEEVKRAQTWFKAVVYPHPNKGASANWGTSAMGGLLSMAIFCDDSEMFNRAVDVYKHGFVINGAVKDGCCGVTQYIDAVGENAESGRDHPHSQGGIGHLVETALVAWNQGLEYTAKYNLGNEVPYHPFFEYCNNVTKYPTGPSAQGRGNFSPVWEMAASLFAQAGLPAPSCDQVSQRASYSPEKTNSDHPGMGTLTFRRKAISPIVKSN